MDISTRLINLLICCTLSVSTSMAQSKRQSKLAERFVDLWKSIPLCSFDCNYTEIFNNELVLFEFMDPLLKKTVSDAVTKQLASEYKKRNDRSAFEMKIPDNLKLMVLENANINSKNKLYIQVVKPIAKSEALTNESVMSLYAEVNTESDEPTLDTIGLNVVNSPLNNESHREVYGISYIGEKPPDFKNFEAITFIEADDFISKDRVESIIKVELNQSYTGKVAFQFKEIKTNQYVKNDITVYKVSIVAENIGSVKKLPELEIEGYFVKTKMGIYEVIQLRSTRRGYYNPVDYIFYGESNSRKIIGIGSNNAFEPSQIILINQDGTVEKIIGKMGATCEHRVVGNGVDVAM